MGKIVSKHDLPRSYILLNDDGSEIRRNRRDIRPSNNEFSLKPKYLPDYSINNGSVDIGLNDKDTNLNQSNREGINNKNIIPENGNGDVPTTIARPRRDNIKKPSRFNDYLMY